MLCRAARIAVCLLSIPASVALAVPEPWRTYAEVAAEIACPEHDRLVSAGVTDENRLDRVHRECQESVARRNPDLVARLIRATEIQPPREIFPRREVRARLLDARLQESREVLGPTRAIVRFLLTEVGRLAREESDALCASRIDAVSRIVSQLSAPASMLHLLIADFVEITAHEELKRMLAERPLGPRSARAALALHEARATQRSDQFHRMVAYESGVTLGLLRRAAPNLCASALAGTLWISDTSARLASALAILSQARSIVEPAYAIRREALLRALAARTLTDSILLRTWRFPQVITERYADTLARLREIAAEPE